MMRDTFYILLGNTSVNIFKGAFSEPLGNTIKITLKKYSLETKMGGSVTSIYSFERDDIITFEDPLYHLTNGIEKSIREKKKGFWIPRNYFLIHHNSKGRYYEGPVFDEPNHDKYSFYFELDDYHTEYHHKYIRFYDLEVLSIKIRIIENGFEMSFVEYLELPENKFGYCMQSERVREFINVGYNFIKNKGKDKYFKEI
ncbi:hypothetical protein D3C77_476310 [compost metagenome]